MQRGKKTICPLDCPDSCGMIASVADGRVKGLAGDKDHPHTNGFICRKMRRYPERLYGESRVLYPQLRAGKKGEGKFRRIGWDEALDIVADRLAETRSRFGGEAILPYSYAGNMGAVNRFAGYPLFHRLGASQLDQTICSAAAGAGWSHQCGDTPGCPPENAADAELIVAWGINIKVTNIHFWQYVAAARKKGGRLLVIDPYRNETAKAADMHLAVLPGGDPALALGVLKALIEGDLIDKTFIARETEGFDLLAESLKSQDWSDLIRESGMSRQDMAELATLLAGSTKTFIRIGIGLSRHSRGGMAVRSITSLAAALGLFAGGPGRGVLLSAGAFRGDKAKLTWPSLAPEKTRVVNMIHLGHALTALQPPVHALFVYNANPASVNPDGALVRQGLAREDLFTVVHEQVMTPTARYADLLLPATTFLENRDIYTAYGHFYLGVTDPVIEPVAEARGNFDLFQNLALKMGFTDRAFFQTCDERIADYLQDMQGLPQSCDIKEVMAGRLVQSVNSCSDGRVLVGRNHRFSFTSAAVGPEPQVPRLSRAGEFDDPDLLARFPLRLIVPPHADLLNSTFGERYSGRLGEVLVHPADAARWDVRDGEKVILKNHRGKVARIARLTTDTRQGVLVAEGIFWPVDEDDSGINDLTSQKLSDMGGGATFHETLVAIEQAP
ncbi:MAG: molybdopterin-dependent oxidoreductase [Proteobacteria bacterium]|nr:molybdopterin-dependent oxidoreductase [Pseudomonadota bacterium]